MPEQHALTPRQALGLLLRQREDLTAQPQERYEALRQVHVELQAADDLLQGFAGLVRARQSAVLAQWLEQAEGSGLPQMQAFVTTLRQDVPAVEAGLTLCWSQG